MVTWSCLILDWQQQVRKVNEVPQVHGYLPEVLAFCKETRNSFQFIVLVQSLDFLTCRPTLLAPTSHLLLHSLQEPASLHLSLIHTHLQPPFLKVTAYLWTLFLLFGGKSWGVMFLRTDPLISLGKRGIREHWVQDELQARTGSSTSIWKWDQKVFSNKGSHWERLYKMSVV